MEIRVQDTQRVRTIASQSGDAGFPCEDDATVESKNRVRLRWPSGQFEFELRDGLRTTANGHPGRRLPSLPYA
jgi:hypothetical protein